MTRQHLRVWVEVTLDYLPLVLTVVGVSLAFMMCLLWPDLRHAYPLAPAVVVLAALALGLAIALVITRRALRRHTLCSGPLVTEGLRICPILATGRPLAGQSLEGGRVVAVHGQAPVARPPDTPRVLVVEDDAIARHILARTLEGAGFQVEATDDGAQALYILGHERPAVMVLDLMLPTLDGPQVARAQQALEESYGTRTRIVVVTANDGALGEAQRFGADAFLVKPVDRAELIRTVRRLTQVAALPQEEIP